MNVELYHEGEWKIVKGVEYFNQWGHDVMVVYDEDRTTDKELFESATVGYAGPGHTEKTGGEYE